MMDRINGVAEPDVNVFNVAKPDKARLSVFELICPLDVVQTEVKTSTKKHARRTRKHSARGFRNNRAYNDFDVEYYYNDDEVESAYQSRGQDYSPYSFSHQQYRP